LAKSLKEDRELKREYAASETARRVFDLAIQMEGTIRSHGVHAAGVVIAPEDIVYYTPLEMAQKGVIATQYSMGPIEELGLLKMDFLGLSNLTILNNALRIVRRVHGEKIELSEIPNDDKKTFKLLQRGDTTGVFQVESAGMKRYLKELKPTLFEDIIAMNALYRPGPMSEIPRFIKGKNDSSSIEYLHESLKPILEDTYGVMVYQEQIIKLLQLVAGYTPGEADLVRKAIGKKKRDIMQAEEPRFIEGCIKQGLTKGDAQKLWAQIQPFADYSFNKAHATCYAQISYWTAYLKAHYPPEFMAALMTSDYDNTDRLAIEITECKYMGITVLPPDVNESFVEFAVVPDKKEIRFGLAAIKNVGTGAVEEILRARDEETFASLEDFLTRVNSGIVNRKAMESLVKAGAFDRFGDRHTLLHNLDLIMAFTARLQKQANSGQTDIFGSLAESVIERPKLDLIQLPVAADEREQLQWERDLLGLYLSQHPLEAFEVFLNEHTVPLNSLEEGHDGKMVTVGGIVTSVREITTRNGRQMAFIKLEDHSGELEIILFPGNYEEHSALLTQDRVVLIKGKVNSRDKAGNNTGEVKVLVEKAREITLEQAESYKPVGQKKELLTPTQPVSEKVYIRLDSTGDEKTLLSLKKTIDSNKGDTEVVLVLGENSSKQAIKLPGGIDKSSAGLDHLKELVGTDNLVIR
jgi:DNA polymerase-3 subunit alpha